MSHPQQPYEHNLNKKCKMDGCDKLGYQTICDICRKQKRKTLCELHLLEHKEMNRLYRGKLSAGVPSMKVLNRINNTPKKK